MGRWSFLKGRVEERPPAETPEYAERFAILKSALSDRNFEQLSDALTLARSRKDDISKQLSEANLEVTVLERLVIEKLEAAGIESITAAGYRLTPSVEPVFKKVDGQKLRAWCEETDQIELLTVNTNTLASLAKDHFLEHGEPPPGVELTGTRTTLSRSKAPVR